MDCSSFTKRADKYYFELPDSLMGRDIMVITRFVKLPVNAGNYGGEELNEEVVRFEKGPNNNLFFALSAVINRPTAPMLFTKQYLIQVSIL